MKERPKDELIFKNTLLTILNGIARFKTQYYVNGFRIDFYFEDYNLAIEYDEEYHNYNFDFDANRQKYIEELIGCHFIRVNKGFEFDGVNQILKFIISKGVNHERIDQNTN